MNLIANVLINVFSILILAALLHQTRCQADRMTLSDRIYLRILQTTMLLLVLDICSRFDGKPETIYPLLNHLGNFLIFFLSPVLPSLWLLYVCWQICQDIAKMRRLRLPLLLVLALNGLLTVLSLFTGWYYDIDAANIYQRGPLYLLATSFSIILILAAFVVTLVKRKQIEPRYFLSLIFFAVPPFISVVLQVSFYGVSLMLNSVVLSILVVFLKVQNHNMNTDYLTRVNNRMMLETYLEQKIKSCSPERSFSAILLDLDNFKTINDSFGHDVGDDVLSTAAMLLKTCIRADDFIARYGGDEFFLILSVSDRDGLERVVCRIRQCLEHYNASRSLPYGIVFSMGYDVYDPSRKMSVGEFERHIDGLMYENKRSQKTISDHAAKAGPIGPIFG